MNYKVLISAPYLIPFIERFRPFFTRNNIDLVIPDVEERLEEDDLLNYIDDLDGIICGDDRITKRVIDNASKLKVVSKWGTGIDSIDKEYCEDNGIAVKNTPNAFTVPVSDTVLAYILNSARNVSAMTDEMRAGKWEKIQGKALHECVLGVIGVGNIGESVLRKASAFGMRLLAYDIKKIPTDLVIELGIEEVSLDFLLKESDYVSINCDLNPSSHHLINKGTLELMKESAVLINTARGPIVKEEDLIEALKGEKIWGACLDVFEYEPIENNNPLLKMKNVMVAPHNSNSSRYAWEFVHTNTINNLMEVLGLDDRV